MDSFHLDALIGSQTAGSAASPDHATDVSDAGSSSECSFDGAPDGRKPPPRDLSHLYSEATNLRVASKMKEYYRFFQIPNIANLAGGKSSLPISRPSVHSFGLPNVQYFPYDTLEAKIAKPVRWTPSPNKQGTADDNEGDEDLVLVTDGVAAVNVASQASSAPSDRAAPERLVVPKISPGGVLPTEKIDLATALQYGGSDGYPPLLSWIRNFAREYLHPNVPYEGGVDVVLTVGSTDGLSKTLELFVDNWNPVRDDISTRPGLLCEGFVYGNVLSQIAPKGLQVVTVEADAEGMVPYGPGGLEDVLANWDETRGRRPHIMYTVTMGHNPTGIVLSLERRKQLYEICSHYDVIIAEDDPYWYLQYPSAAVNEAASRNLPTPKSPVVPPTIDEAAGQRSTGFAFLDSLVPSFLAVDVDGRVVRLDTFSKTVAPGCRLGWITAQPAFIERFTRIAETGTAQPSGFVQSLISELVMGPLPSSGASSFSASASSPSSASPSATEMAVRKKSKSDPTFSGWQVGGWVRWLEGLRGEYERRMNRMCTILDEGSFQLKQGTPVRSSDADWGVITKTQLYSYDWPRGGMFVWIRLHFEVHPLWQAPRANGVPGDVIDGPLFSMALMFFLSSKPHLVLISPGTMFSADDSVRAERGWAYYRLCFAAESDANLIESSKRLVTAIHKFWKIKKAQDFEDILNSSPAAMADAAEASENGDLGNLGVWMGC
ncbi:aromatic amino acid aminotransferase [Sporothrix brasiliensis 5110]|uniref:Aromatic amino acid aminotransferase n=1 Tax=Sporothrix brasiliensis 5110 TaxID=1398154 RepID=A0A0C2ITM7_9PEZI|nr:aromatic amino acid aminotransferase [Sporothrix brasiliensis 5110]KIH88382.1 aromatic amino acid aminotransferase [Sporothrix brasiliensis 5110]